MFYGLGHFAIKHLMFNDDNSSLHRKTYTMSEIVFVTNIVSMFDNNITHQIDAPILLDKYHCIQNVHLILFW